MSKTIKFVKFYLGIFTIRVFILMQEHLFFSPEGN